MVLEVHGMGNRTHGHWSGLAMMFAGAPGAVFSEYFLFFLSFLSFFPLGILDPRTVIKPPYFRDLFLSGRSREQSMERIGITHHHKSKTTHWYHGQSIF